MEERFNWYLDKLRNGETLNINAYDYGDFLRYISSIGLAEEFNNMTSERKILDDFPIVTISLGLAN